MNVKLPKISKITHVFRSKSPSKRSEQNLIENVITEYVNENPTAESLYKLALVRLLKGDLDAGFKLLGECLEKDGSSTVRNLAFNTKQKVYDAVRLMKKAEGLVGEKKYELALSRLEESLLIFRDFAAIQLTVISQIIDVLQLISEKDPRILEYVNKFLSLDKHNIQMLRVRSEIFQREDRIVDFLRDLTHLNLLLPSDGKIAVDLEKTRRIMHSPSSSHYAILRIAPDSSQSEIEKAYKKARMLALPQHFCDDEWFKHKAEIKMRAVEEAFDVLRDEKKRKEYDEQRMNDEIQTRKRQNSNHRLDPKANEISDIITSSSRKNLSLEVSKLRRENYILHSKVCNLKAKIDNRNIEKLKNSEIIQHGKRSVISLKSKVKELERLAEQRRLEYEVINEETDVEEIKDIYMLENMRKGFEVKLKNITNRIHTINDQIHERIKNLRTKEKQCAICFNQPYEVALNCGHVCCESCGESLDVCVFCRSKITSQLKLFGI